MDPFPPGPDFSGPGLSARELAAVGEELEQALVGATLTGAALVHGTDDLLLFATRDGSRATLHLAPGGPRARITVTARRFAKDELDDAPRAHQVAALLIGNAIESVRTTNGQRVAHIGLRGPTPARALHVELFGPRGLWAICDGEDRILALSRLPQESARSLRPGERFTAAPPRALPGAELPERFTPPLLGAIDLAYAALDARLAERTLRETLATAIARLRKRCRDRLDGLAAQESAIAGADLLRRHADLLLAYGGGLAPGARQLDVVDPLDETRRVVIERDPALPHHEQARRMYDRARRLDAARDIAVAQRATAQADLASADALAARLADALGLAALRALHDELVERGALPRPRKPRAQPSERARKLAKITRGENFRRFTSGEGQLILVGRDNEQNDRLSIKVARGNDLWLHVGRGYAGSHVVVRLERGKQASLQTLLDAGTLAIHFSKVRGTEAEEVIYTQARNVRKPKGLPPGKVLAHHHKAIRVRVEEERLRRLLASAQGDESA
ncbi:MAG: NFACT RNA binding domain-containing protein [Planctomycetota bacterium]